MEKVYDTYMHKLMIKMSTRQRLGAFINVIFPTQQNIFN
jgi:hypothetical protein